jgi:DEAD/DEAH box helicase domain-containing protein
MAPNIIVLDIETQNSFDDVGGFRNLEALKVSLVGTYLYKTNEYRCFLENEIGELEKLLMEKPLVVGFNTRKFDFAVLKPYLKFNPDTLPQLDVMEEMTKVLGHRVSLDSVASATLGTKKSGSGLDAIKYFREGEIEKLKKYCLDDVRITRELYEYGAKNKELFYTSKYGNARKSCAIQWAIPDSNESSAEQISLF